MVTLNIPVEYNTEFTGRAFILETKQIVPSFRVALCVESFKQKYTCSLDVFLGDVKVWSSGHFLRLFTEGKCVLELTQDGDLKLNGRDGRVGWRTATSGQGVQSLHLLRTGNLVLVDSLNLIKWQTFNFPTNIMLWGQRLNVATQLTSFPTNSSGYFFSFEIERGKVALYLNSGRLKYSYWEFRPPVSRNITFIKVGNRGIDIFGDRYTKIAEITSSKIRIEPLRFLRLANETGNLGLYYYSEEKQKFEVSFQALSATCDLPLACNPYGICTLSNVCSCVRLIDSKYCSNGFPQMSCVRNKVSMVELKGVKSVLKSIPKNVSMSKEECASLCLDDCNCTSASYDSISEECSLYSFVRGIKQVEYVGGLSYMVKVPKEIARENENSSGLKNWVIVVVGMADGLVLVLVFGGVTYYIIHKRRQNLQ